MPITKNESRTVSHEKAENGFIITMETRNEKKNGEFDYKRKRYISSSAIQTEKMIAALAAGKDPISEAKKAEADNS